MGRINQLIASVTAVAAMVPVCAAAQTGVLVGDFRRATEAINQNSVAMTVRSVGSDFVVLNGTSSVGLKYVTVLRECSAIGGNPDEARCGKVSMVCSFGPGNFDASDMNTWNRSKYGQAYVEGEAGQENRPRIELLMVAPDNASAAYVAGNVVFFSKLMLEFAIELGRIEERKAGQNREVSFTVGEEVDTATLLNAATLAHESTGIDREDDHLRAIYSAPDLVNAVRFDLPEVIDPQ